MPTPVRTSIFGSLREAAFFSVLMERLSASDAEEISQLLKDIKEIMEERKEVLQRLTNPNKIEQYVEQVFEDIQKRTVPSSP